VHILYFIHIHMDGHGFWDEGVPEISNYTQFLQCSSI